MTQLKYHDGDRFRDAPKFRELPEPVGDPLFWWPLHAGYQSETTGFGQGTIYGAQWRRGNYAGQWALEGDGVDDYVATSDWGNFGSNMANNFSIVTTVQFTTDGTNEYFIGHRNSGNAWLVLTANSGSLQFFIRDIDNNEIGQDTDLTYNDGEKHRAVINKTGNAASDIDIYVDSELVDSTQTEDENYGNVEDFEFVVFMLARNNEGSPDMFADVNMDNVIVYDYALSQSEIAEDYRRQPWSEVN